MIVLIFLFILISTNNYQNFACYKNIIFNMILLALYYCIGNDR